MSLLLSTTDPRTSMYRTVQPTQYPVTIGEAKDRIGLGDDPLVDDEITSIIAAATQLVEDTTSRAFMTQTRELDLDYFPEEIEIRCIPVTAASVVINYITGGVSTLLDAGDYEVDVVSRPPRVRTVDGVTWPDTDDTLRAVRITFTAGYSSIDQVPALAKRAILEAVDSMYRGCDMSFMYYTLVSAIGWGGYR